MTFDLPTLINSSLSTAGFWDKVTFDLNHPEGAVELSL